MENVKDRAYIRFDEASSTIINSATQIYAAHILSDKQFSGSREQLIEESVETAIKIAEIAESRVVGFNEKKSSALV